MSIEKTLGDVVRRLRIERGFSQIALSATSNLDRSYISLVECGKKNPTLVSLFSLASGLGVSPHRLLSEVEAVLAINACVTGHRTTAVADHRSNRQRRVATKSL